MLHQKKFRVKKAKTKKEEEKIMIAREQELDNGRVVAVQKIQLGQFCLDRRTLNSDRENRFCKLASVSVSVDVSVCRSGQQKKNFVFSS